MVEKNKNRFELHVALSLVVFGLIVLFIILFQVEKVTLTGKLNTRTFPLFTIYLFLILTPIYLMEEIKKIISNKTINKKNIINFKEYKINKNLIISILFIFMYIICLNWVNYVYSTIVFSGIISLFLGCRKWYLLLFVCIIFPLIIYYVFHILLLIPLP